MVKGRNSKVVSIRISDEVYSGVKLKVEKRGLSVGDWIKLVMTEAVKDGEWVNEVQDIKIERAKKSK
jgi:hypothetical protein